MLEKFTDLWTSTSAWPFIWTKFLMNIYEFVQYIPAKCTQIQCKGSSVTYLGMLLSPLIEHKQWVSTTPTWLSPISTYTLNFYLFLMYLWKFMSFLWIKNYRLHEQLEQCIWQHWAQQILPVLQKCHCGSGPRLSRLLEWVLLQFFIYNFLSFRIFLMLQIMHIWRVVASLHAR